MKRKVRGLKGKLLKMIEENEDIKNGWKEWRKKWRKKMRKKRRF